MGVGGRPVVVVGNTAAAGERGLGKLASVGVGDLEVDAVDMQPVAESRRREAGRPTQHVAVQRVVGQHARQ